MKDNEKQTVITTIGQLNFFRWAIQYNIIEYAKQNLKKIENDMNNSIQMRKGSKNRQKKKRLFIHNHSTISSKPGCIFINCGCCFIFNKIK